MMKKLFYIGLALFLSIMPTSAMVKEYFNTFYYNYLDSRKIDRNDAQNFDFLHKMSNDKVYWINRYLNNPNSKMDKQALITLLDEEYWDLRENLDFESEFVKSCPLSKRQDKAFKRAHKKFMCKLKKDCRECQLNERLTKKN